MEIDVGFDRRRHVATRSGAAADVEQQATAMGELRRVVGGGEPGRRAVERPAHDVQVLHLLHVERRHGDALAAGIDQEALAAQQHHGLQHGLAADAKPVGELLLGDAGASLQFA